MSDDDTKTGNHALCGQIARLLETQKIDGRLNEHQLKRLAALRMELLRRIERSLPA